MGSCSDETKDILYKSLEGVSISESEALHLLGVTGHDYQALLFTANYACSREKGDLVSFVVNRNINFTNACVHKCRFCAFSLPARHPDAYWLSHDDIAEKVREAVERGCTEVCIQGGLNPSVKLEDYIGIVETVRSVSKDIHMHAFSPEEIHFAALQSESSYREVLSALKRAGLGSIPGTAAEILVDDVRAKICPEKLSTREWVEIVETAHGLGIPSTCTMMYGHVESLQDRVKHLRVLRDIQATTGGFTEFVPLPFVSEGVKSLDPAGKHSGAYGIEDLKVFAVARLYLQGFVDNIQCSWVKLGPRFAQTTLYAGVNDFSGTLMEENISKSAGSTYGEYLPPEAIVELIRNAGKTPVQRDTLYKTLRVF
ncbi:MAG: 5-amino-6-(D-ribitylamino)uracil--L-tyrosine 4-hydroxyphenyl transferase CofH [Promethearchaeota archaeon]